MGWRGLVLGEFDQDVGVKAFYTALYTRLHTYCRNVVRVGLDLSFKCHLRNKVRTRWDVCLQNTYKRTQGCWGLPLIVWDNGDSRPTCYSLRWIHPICLPAPSFGGSGGAGWCISLRFFPFMVKAACVRMFHKSHPSAQSPISTKTTGIGRKSSHRTR